MVLPSYTVLQDLVGKLLTEEQQRLMQVLQTNLAPHERAACDALLVETDRHYPLTQLKHTPKDISLAEMRRELGRAEQLRALYPLAQQIMPRLEIACEGIATLRLAGQLLHDLPARAARSVVGLALLAVLCRPSRSAVS